MIKPHPQGQHLNVDTSVGTARSLMTRKRSLEPLLEVLRGFLLEISLLRRHFSCPGLLCQLLLLYQLYLYISNICIVRVITNVT